jgi:hypothetical protein
MFESFFNRVGIIGWQYQDPRNVALVVHAGEWADPTKQLLLIASRNA